MQSLTILLLIVTLAIILIIVAANLYGIANKNKTLKPKIIFKKYSPKSKLQPVSKDIVAGTSYLLYSANDTPIAAMALTCSFMTHLYCFVSPDQKGIDQHLAAKTKLSRVESNIMPDNFYIYCNQDDSKKLMQIFDTQTLSYLSEFCKFYDLEVADNQLVYALRQSDPDKSNEAIFKSDGNQLYQMINPKTIEWYKQIEKEFTL